VQQLSSRPRPRRLFALRPTGACLVSACLVSACLAASPLRAADPCSDFSADVSRERALFAGEAIADRAGADSASAPLLLPERVYALQLRPISEVTFVAAPGRKAGGEHAYAGLAMLRIETPGIYRIALDAPLWVDVVADGGTLPVKAFQGAQDCNAPHKILEFEFAVARKVVLQFSGEHGSTVRVAILTPRNP